MRIHYWHTQTQIWIEITMTGGLKWIKIDSSYVKLCNIYTIYTYIPLTLLSLKGEQRHLRYSYETPTLYQNYLAMSNTVDVTGGKPSSV
jgi:hypothetical protein